MPAADRPNPRSERTRAALIGAGRRLFSERPVDAVTIDDIVSAAGVGKGSFYNHFEDRDGLVRAIAVGMRKSIEAAVTRANTEVSDPARRLVRAVCIYLRYALDEPEPAKVLVRIHSGHTSLDAPLNRGLVEDMSQGLAAGRFAVATSEAGVLYVLGVSQLTLARMTQDIGKALAVSLAQQMCALLLRGLGLSGQEAHLIAAQESDEIMRRGLFAPSQTNSAGATH